MKLSVNTILGGKRYSMGEEIEEVWFLHTSASMRLSLREQRRLLRRHVT